MSRRAIAARELTPALLRRYPLSLPAAGGDKNDHGRVVIVAGSPQVPAAALLAAEAALRTGAGKVSIAVPRAAMVAAAVAIPEARVMPLEGRASSATFTKKEAVLVGPGMLPRAAARWRRAALASGATVVLDASAIAGLRPADRKASTILTPHAHEMALLSGRPVAEIERDPLAVARDIAGKLGVIVVLKGVTTVICGGDRALFWHRAEIPGLGSSGSGDVLAGLIAGLAAQGHGALQACLWAVSLHAAAGRRLARRLGPTGYFARELAQEVPALLARARLGGTGSKKKPAH